MITAAVLTVTFITGLLAGVVVLMRLAVAREHREGRLGVVAPTPLTAAARLVSGLHIEVPASRSRPIPPHPPNGNLAGRAEVSPNNKVLSGSRNAR